LRGEASPGNSSGFTGGKVLDQGSFFDLLLFFAVEEPEADLPKDDPEYVFENVDYLFDDLDERTSDSGSHCKD